MTYISEGHFWHDIGTVNSYIRANKEMLDKEPFSLGSGLQMDPSVRLEEWAIVGNENCLEKDVEIRRSILWDNVKVKKGIRIIDSVVTSFKQVDTDLISDIY